MSEMPESPKVSVVMPVYNGEDYLEETLASVLAQTMPDFELICVNDGSTDESLMLLERIASEDDRVRVVAQENAGVSAARNRGMLEARGTFLIFFDDDDLMEPAMLEKLSAQMEAADAEICATSGYKLDMLTGDQSVVKSFLRMDYVPNQPVFSPKDLGKHLLNFASFHICNKMYKTAFVEEAEIKFKPQRVAEDALFYVEALLAAKRITVVDDCLFVYRKNTGGSVSDSVAEADILAGFQMLREVKKLLVQNDMYEEPYRESYANRALMSVFHYRNQAASYEALAVWYEQLIEGALTEFDLEGHEENYYYSDSMARQLRRLLESRGLNDYLFMMYRAMRERSERLKVKNEQLKAKVAKLKQEASLSSEKTSSEIAGKQRKNLRAFAKRLRG